MARPKTNNPKISVTFRVPGDIIEAAQSRYLDYRQIMVSALEHYVTSLPPLSQEELAFEQQVLDLAEGITGQGRLDLLHRWQNCDPEDREGWTALDKLEQEISSRTGRQNIQLLAILAQRRKGK